MRLLKYIQEEGVSNLGATITSDVAKYEPKLSFMSRRRKKVRKPKVGKDETK